MPATMDAYIRVSRTGERDEEESVEVYREQVAEWAASEGVKIGQRAEETDVSGSTAVSGRKLERLVRRVEEGVSNGVVTPFLDRFGRDLIEGALALKRIHEAGGKLVAFKDGFDSTSPGSKLVFNLRMAIAEDFLDRVKSNWNTATSRAVANGIHVACKAPLGYLRQDAVDPRYDARGKLIRDGRLVVDEATAPFIKRAFELRRDGSSYQAIADFLKGKLGRGIAKSSVSGILKNRAYLGEARGPNGAANPEAHDAIVDDDLFARVQATAGEYHTRDGSIASQAMLGGVVYCGGCGHKCSVSGSTDPKTGKRIASYVCKGKRASGDCSNRAVARVSLVDGFVLDLIKNDEDGSIVSGALAAEQEYLVAREAVREAEQALDEWVDDPALSSSLGRSRFQRGILKRQEALDEARQVLWAIDDRHVDEDDADAPVVWIDGKPHVYRPWGEDREKDKKHLRRFIESVTLTRADPKRRRWQPIEERVAVKWVGQAESAEAPKVAA
jgi:DNA invertase Pin-like site-specific DNA recombinase